MRIVEILFNCPNLPKETCLATSIAKKRLRLPEGIYRPFIYFFAHPISCHMIYINVQYVDVSYERLDYFLQDGHPWPHIKCCPNGANSIFKRTFLTHMVDFQGYFSSRISRTFFNISPLYYKILHMKNMLKITLKSTIFAINLRK